MSKIFELRAMSNFRGGNISGGTHCFHRALDLNGKYRLDLLNKIGPKPDREVAESFRRSGEAFLLRGEDGEASENFSAAIALSGYFSETRRLDKTIEPLVESDNLIVTQVAYNYFPIFRVWYRNMTNLGIRNILLIALDPLTATRAEELNIPYWYLPIFGFQKSVRRLIWTETMKVRQKILNLGVNYLHSDADAIWLSDARADVFMQDSDIVASTASGTPRSALDAWGFVLCLGFYFCRSNDRTRAIYHKYIDYAMEFGHDQNGLNQMLVDFGLEWKSEQNGYYHGYCGELGLSVAALPQKVVARPKGVSERCETKVIHPILSSSDIRGKIQILADFGVDAGVSQF